MKNQKQEWKKILTDSFMRNRHILELKAQGQILSWNQLKSQLVWYVNSLMQIIFNNLYDMSIH